jgi:hypothetical protein
MLSRRPKLKSEHYALVRKMNRAGYSAEEIVAALDIGISARGLRLHMKSLGTTLHFGHGKRAHRGDDTVLGHEGRNRNANDATG